MNNTSIFEKMRNAASGLLTVRNLAVVTAAVLFFLFLSDCSGGGVALAMAAVTGVAGGRHVAAEPLTTDLTRELSPDLLLNEIDRRIVKIRPMATPIDQLSRWAGAKKAGSMIVDYYSVDTRPTVSKVTKEHTWDGDSMGNNVVQLKVENAEVFEPSETVLVKGVHGYEPDGQTESNHDLVLYVVGKDKSAGSLSVIAVNGLKDGETENCVPTIPLDSVLVRIGRAASELDVQTAQFEALPKKAQNYCQIFKMQIEQSTLQRIANKEVGWTFSDQEEAAVYDMRLGMEKNYLFGVKARISDPEKNDTVLLTGGIWHQAGGEFTYKKGELNQNAVISMMRQAFTGNAGTKRKVLIGGSGLIEQLNQLDSTKVVMAGESIVKWGIDFSEMRSKFGRLYVLLSEVFDECGMENNGMIIDPEYLQKYSHIPFTTEQLNLKQAGVRNTDAIVLTEASCMTLRYPKAHLRIVCNG